MTAAWPKPHPTLAVIDDFRPERSIYSGVRPGHFKGVPARLPQGLPLPMNWRRYSSLGESTMVLPPLPLGLLNVAS